jgi:hypothetical protein
MEAREAQLNEYMGELQQMLLNPVSYGEQIDAWLNKGDGYHRGLKRLAERAIYKLMKAREEVRERGSCQETETLLTEEVIASGTRY